MSSTPDRPYQDRRDEIVLFDAADGRYQITRAERYRLAILHGKTEAEARHLAYGPPAANSGAPRKRQHGFTADELAARFHADGSSKGAGLALRPNLPRVAGAVRPVA